VKGPRSRRSVWIGLVVGVALVSLSYALAGRSTSSGEQAKFIVLWLGLVAFLWPAAKRLAEPLVSEAERLAILTAGAMFTFLPKFLRNPTRPIFYDEIAHWTQVERLMESGNLFRTNPAVRVLPSYPGLHTATAGIRELTGLSTWQVGILMVALLHVVSTIGVFVLVRRLVSSPVIAGLAGLLWCVAPGAMFFNSQYAYQSLAIVAFVWVAVGVAEAEASVGRLRWRWTVLAATLATFIVVTHHLTSYAMVVMLAAFTIAAVIWRRQEQPGAWKPAATLLGVALGANAAWMVVRGGSAAVESIREYLMPYPESGFEQLWDVLSGETSRRTFFARSGLPAWERAAAFLAPLAVIVLGAIGIRLLTKMAKKPRSGTWALAGFSLLYVVALPLVLTQTGAQGAHRSFPFTYLGIVLLAAAGLALVIGRTATGNHRRLASFAIASVIAVITIGNTAANVNEFDRFPGPWEPGADSRAITPELTDASAWLRGYESEDRVVADLYSGTSFGVFGTVREACAVAASCPGDLEIWRFYDGQPIRQQDLDQLREDGYRFLVVDKRIGGATPRSGFWFNRDEEGAYDFDEPYPPEALSRLEGFTWLTKIYSSTNFDVYSIHVGAADADVLEGEPGEVTVAAEEKRRKLAEEQGTGTGSDADVEVTAEGGGTETAAGAEAPG
jgi:hypothetical protein